MAPDLSQISKSENRRLWALRLVHVAVFFAVQALMFHLMGLFWIRAALGCCLLWSLLVLLCHAFIPHHKATKRAVVSSIVVSSLLAVLVVNAIYSTRPARLFREFVLDPLPPSARITECKYYGPSDETVFLRFSISPDDVQRVLDARNYSLSKLPKKIRDPLAPAWWKPDELKDPILYEWQGESAHGTDYVKLWTNSQKDEMLFLYTSP